MWVMTMFDLPVDTKKARRAYAVFRKKLLKDGFAKMQFSVYIRHCASEENANVHMRRVELAIPDDGEVRVDVLGDGAEAVVLATQSGQRISVSRDGSVDVEDGKYILTDGTPQPDHNFHVAGDSDWAAFSATAGDNYVIETFNLGVSSDTFMELYDTDAVTLITFDDDGGDGLASRIEWTAPVNGTYSVRVRHYNSGASGPDTNYDLRVTGTSSSPGGDVYEDDDGELLPSPLRSHPQSCNHRHTHPWPSGDGHIHELHDEGFDDAGGLGCLNGDDGFYYALVFSFLQI